MTGNEVIAAVVGGSTALGGFIRWAAGRLASSWDNLAAVIQTNTNALLKAAEVMGRVDVRTEEVGDRMIEIHDEISGVKSTTTATEHVERITTTPHTPPKGIYHFKRPGTKGT